jgi:signal transduction histidine kinase/CheY-like chemotaxis protein
MAGKCLSALVAVIILALAAGAVSPVRAGERKRVLLLNSYHPGYRWTDDLTRAVQARIAERRGVLLSVEYMDAKRWTDPSHEAMLFRLLRHKYAARPGREPLAAALVADDHALDFALKHRDDLFSGVPLVFCGINDFRPERIAGHPAVTGVVEEYDFAGTLELILALHPDTREFLVVGDQTLSGRAALDRLARAIPLFADRAAFRMLSDVTAAELVDDVRMLDPGAVVLYVSFLQDRNGALFELQESRRLVTRSARVPAYCFWDFVEGSGLTGGRGLSASNQGDSAAGLILRILAGADPDGMPVLDIEPSPYHFDEVQLRRFGVSESALPAGSILVNRAETFYGRNWPWLWGVGGFLFLEGMLVTGLVLLLRKRRRLQEQLRQAQKMEAVGRLAGGIAHDFRNQLTVIEGYCDLLLRGDPLDEARRVRVERIRDAARRSSRLTGQLLAYSRQQVLQAVWLDLGEVLRELGDSLVRLIGEDIELAIGVAPDVRSVFVDRVQLEHAILNLVTNARDAMPRGGKLWLRASNVDPGDPQISRLQLRSEREYVRMEVRDSGTGIPGALKERIFDPFFTTKDVGKGTGLGLSMVYGFVRQSDGAIEVESIPGHGAAFFLLLPAGRGMPVTAAGPSPTTDERPARKAGVILVVEDDAAVLELTVDSLESMGYKVLQAAHPGEAVTTAATAGQPIDLLISDVIMPGMYGPQLAERLRERFPALPVLFVSGYTQDALRHIAPDERNVLFLNKPFSAEQLSDAVGRLLS